MVIDSVMFTGSTEAMFKPREYLISTTCDSSHQLSLSIYNFSSQLSCFNSKKSRGECLRCPPLRLSTWEKRLCEVSLSPRLHCNIYEEVNDL